MVTSIGVLSRIFLLIAVVLPTMDFLVGSSLAYASNLSTSKYVTVMSFNVENLFDVNDAVGKNDEAFLPLDKKKNIVHMKKCDRVKRDKWKLQCLYLNWSEAVLQKKLKNLSEVIRFVNSGRGPDILVVQEVENRAVLERLRLEYLNGLGYNKSVLIEGNDIRGIDIGVLTRLKLKSLPKLHTVPFKSISKKVRDDTRGILEVSVVLPDGTDLFVYGVHFPAPFHSSKLRAQALRFLDDLVQRHDRKKTPFVALGDFNIPGREDEKESLLANNLSSIWKVAHKLGCKGCLGTQYYPPKNEWSFLDMILFSDNMLEPTKNMPWKAEVSSFEVVKSGPGQLTENGQPASFDVGTGNGVSDHLPIVMRLKYGGM